jgi:hypothetical protein
VNALGAMDAVIHNAAIYSERNRNPTSQGHAGILAVNTLAPYMLTVLIERPRRLIYLSSGLHRGGKGSLRDLDWTKRQLCPEPGICRKQTACSCIRPRASPPLAAGAEQRSGPWLGADSDGRPGGSGRS